MIKVDMGDAFQYEKKLKRFNKRAFPYATRHTVNEAAFKGREIAHRIIGREFTLRNQWTRRGVRVAKTGTLNVSRQAARLGHVDEYMRDQEFGAAKRNQGGKGLPIVTSYGAGQNMKQVPRTKLPRRANKLGNLGLPSGSRPGKTKAQRNAIAVAMAAKAKRKNVYLDPAGDGGEGVYRIMRGRKSKKNRTGVRSVRMIYDLSRDTVHVPRTPWLWPATREAKKAIPRIYIQALKFQLRKHNITD